MKKKNERPRPLFIGRPCRFKSKKAYDRNKQKKEDREYILSYKN